MSDTSQPVPPAQAPKTFWQKASRWTMIVAAIILGISGLIKLIVAFVPSLPSCTSETATAALRNIFKQKNVELTGLTDAKALTDTSSEKTCQAQVETLTERAAIFYRIYWQGNDANVMITKVDSQPR